jgi:hypothetical protein
MSSFGYLVKPVALDIELYVRNKGIPDSIHSINHSLKFPGYYQSRPRSCEAEKTKDQCEVCIFIKSHFQVACMYRTAIVI